MAISVSGTPVNGSPLVQTVRGVGAVSNDITKLRAGQELGVRSPYGTAWRELLMSHVAQAKGFVLRIIGRQNQHPPNQPARTLFLPGWFRWRVGTSVGVKRGSDCLTVGGSQEEA